MLARIGVLLIENYWRRIPEQKRKVCLHKKSCSRAVYDDLIDYGFWRGINTYLYRRKTCNGKYVISKINGKVTIETKRGIIILEDEVNPIIIKEFNSST